MSDSEEDDVPLSKLVTRLKQQQQQPQEASSTPPASPSTKTPPPSPSPQKNPDTGETADKEEQYDGTGKTVSEDKEGEKEETSTARDQRITPTESVSESLAKQTVAETDSAVTKVKNNFKDESNNENHTPSKEQKEERTGSEDPPPSEENESKDTRRLEEHSESDAMQKGAQVASPTPGSNESGLTSQAGTNQPSEVVDANSSLTDKTNTGGMDISKDSQASSPDEKSAETMRSEADSNANQHTTEVGMTGEEVAGMDDNKDSGRGEGVPVHEDNVSSEKTQLAGEGNRVSEPQRPSQPRKTPEEEAEELQDVFPDMVVPKKRKGCLRARTDRRKVPKISIHVGGGSSKPQGSQKKLPPAERLKYEDTMRHFEEKLYGSFSGDRVASDEDDSDTLIEFEDSLSFYSETHEDQDPAFVLFCKGKEKQRLQDELSRVTEAEKSGIAEIEKIVDAQLKEKQASADRNIEKLRSKASIEENRDLQKLLQIYNEKTTSNQNKINQGLKVLSRRHHQEMQKAMVQHQQQVRQRGIPEQVATAEWANASQQLQAKQQRQMQEFNAKGEEVKRKCEGDYKREQEKLRNHHEKRKREMEHGMNKVLARMHSNFQQQRQRHLQRHIEKMKKQKEAILSKLKSQAPLSMEEQNGKEASESSSQKEKEALSASLPIKSSIVPLDEKDGAKSAAAARYKHRKSMLGVIPKQLSVEIHNEGLWMSSLVEKNSKKDGSQKSPSNKETEKKDSSDTDYEFIPWGVKARTALHSIICGEIPLGYGSDRFDFGDAIANQGGHIRCVVTDMRTSDVTASSERAAAMKEEQEAGVIDLERKSKKLTELVTEAEKNHARADAELKECLVAVEKAKKEHDKGKQMLLDFRTKFKNYFGPDGNPVATANPSDRQKLMQAMMRYKANVETAETREKTVKATLAETKAHVQKMNLVVRQTQKASVAAAALLKRKKAMMKDGKTSRGGRSKISEAAELERASNRVKDVISVFRRTANRRREQLNQKRSSSASSTWVQTLPGVSGPLKKSLWHKMHRRRLQIVLRPTMTSTVLALKDSVKDLSKDVNSGSLTGGLDPALRAEQLFLLTAYPATPSDPLPSTPSSRSAKSWAEPGWHLVLDVPTEAKRTSSLLPCRPSFPVLEKNLSDVCSAPGRQAASMIKVPFLRTLMAPLSAAAQATSLAETNPSALSSSAYVENDPLSTSEAALKAGYQFPTKTATKAPSQTRKRSSAAVSKEEPESTTTSKRKSSGDTTQSGRSSGTSGTSERRSTSSKSERTKRSRSKTIPDTSSQWQAKTTKSESGASVSRQTIESHAHSYVQQQASPAPIGMRGTGVYAQQQTQPSMEQQAAQYNQYMKQRDAMQMQQQVSSVQSPSQQQQQQQHVALQQLQTQQPQLLPPQPQQYASPQQQFHQQQQMAQMRIMQQQQQQGRPSQVAPPYAPQQTPQGMQAFFPPMPQQANRQKSYGNQQPMQVPMNRSGSMGMNQPMGATSRPSSSPARRGSQHQDDSQHDPLLFLK